MNEKSEGDERREDGGEGGEVIKSSRLDPPDKSQMRCSLLDITVILLDREK